MRQPGCDGGHRGGHHGGLGLSRPLDIAFLVHDFHRHGGHSRYVAELAQRFRGHHQVHVYCNRVDDPDTEGIRFHHVPAWRATALSTILSFVVPATLMVGRHDIVHAQGLCGLRHNVATAHILTPAWAMAQRACKARGSWKGWLAERLVTPLERVALTGRGVRKVIAVSRLAADCLEHHYGRRDGVVVMPHGVDPNTFHPGLRRECRPELLDRLGLPDSAVLALFAGNLEKGGETAVETVARVPGVHLLLATPSEPGGALARARKLGVSDRVRMLGFSREPQRWMAGADLMLFPTPFDTFGLVILEAMACGLPVVTTRRAGASELVSHGNTGWLVDDPADLEGLSEGLGLLTSDAGTRERMGRAGRVAAEGRTWDAVADETMRIYREVAGK